MHHVEERLFLEENVLIVPRRKRLDYLESVAQFYDLPDSKRSDDEINVLCQIAVNCPRTVPDVSFFQQTQVHKLLELILYTCHKAGQTEIQIFKKHAFTDRAVKRHRVRFLSSFTYRNHLCLVFESLHLNLREVLKKFGRNTGLKLSAVRPYSKPLFIALKHLKNWGVLHCDIKHHNMLRE